RLVDIAKWYVDRLEPPLAAAPVHPQGGLVRVGPWVEDPVLLERRYIQVEGHVADQILIGAVLRNDLDDQDRTDVLPPPLLPRQVVRVVGVRGDVRFGLGRPVPRRDEDPGG